jgi:hypothetical protein
MLHFSEMFFLVVFGDKKVSWIPESHVGTCQSWPVQASTSHVTTRVFSVIEYKKCTQTSKIIPYLDRHKSQITNLCLWVTNTNKFWVCSSSSSKPCQKWERNNTTHKHTQKLKTIRIVLLRKIICYERGGNLGVCHRPLGIPGKERRTNKCSAICSLKWLIIRLVWFKVKNQLTREGMCIT